MHHPTDRIAHTTAFVTPLVEHWLEREIAQLSPLDKLPLVNIDFVLLTFALKRFFSDIVSHDEWCVFRKGITVTLEYT